MKIFNWMQKKINGPRHVFSKKLEFVSPANHYIQQEPPSKEETSDWPEGLLAIGTIGSNNLKDFVSTDDLIITPEEERKLQHELNLLLQQQQGPELELAPNLSLDIFLNDDSTTNNNNDTSVAFSRSSGKKGMLSSDNVKSGIGKKSFSFLLKKMFVCRNGFGPGLRDPIPESRMEKIFRAILHKKIYPQCSSTTTRVSTKNYIEDRYKPTKSGVDYEDGDFTDEEEAENGNKWVKTDSEYIVLEI